LIALFERAVGLYGELINVNAYHQPGVEAGKKAAAAVLEVQQHLDDLMADGQQRALEQIAADLKLESPEPVFWILRHLNANPRGYVVEGDWSVPAQLRFQRVNIP
jgi:glucose-6-phosphate isomerase